MPNWVHHKLTITGPAEERERFLGECFTAFPDGTELDLDKVIPGTDRHAFRTDLDHKGDQTELRFDTKWAPPCEAIEKIAERFPDLTIEGYLHEEMGHFEGTIYCHAGRADIKRQESTWRDEASEMLGGVGGSITIGWDEDEKKMVMTEVIPRGPQS